ncbi:MAG: hypothetical protein Q4G34_02575 [Micrococcus sp.]|nr:hypothetical protein [Micrococcus sp.]
METRITQPRGLRLVTRAGLGVLAATALVGGLAGCSSPTAAPASTTAAAQAPGTTASASGGAAATEAEAAAQTTHEVMVSYPHYTLASEVREAAEAVVVGTVTEVRAEEIDIFGEPGATAPAGSTEPEWLVYTIYTVSVENTLQGDLTPGDTVEIAVMGGSLPDHVTNVPGSPELTRGSTYLLMVGQGGTYPGLINDTEGAFLLREDGTLEPVEETTLPDQEVRVLAAEVRG